MTATTTLLHGNGAKPGSPLGRLKLNTASLSNGSGEHSKGNRQVDKSVLVDPFNYVVSDIGLFFDWLHD